MAPQVLEGSYDERCDLWSIGVVSYLLLSGKQPFWGPPKKMAWKDRRKVMIGLIAKCEYSPMTCRSWKIVSNEAKEFVQSLLQINPNERPTASEALKSKWIQKMSYHRAESSESVALDDERGMNLKQVSLMRRRLWELLSTSLSEDEIEGLRAYVEAKDEDGGCMISIKAFREILLEVSDNSGCCESNRVKEIFDETDDIEGQFNYVDFFAEVLVGKGRNTVDELAKILDELDVSGTRQVAAKDIRPVVESQLPSDVLDGVWNSQHLDEDGNINTSEFLSSVTRMMAGRHRESIRCGQCKC